MLLIRTFIAPSSIHGCGVFAAEPVHAGTLVWEFNEVIDLEITADQIAQLPLAARETALARSFVNEDGRLILARDNGVFFNHSDAPNTDAGPEGNRANRDIVVGEELTEDYRRLGLGGCRTFLDNVNGQITTEGK
jgi:SET domain-containing protein